MILIYAPRDLFLNKQRKKSLLKVSDVYFEIMGPFLNIVVFPSSKIKFALLLRFFFKTFEGVYMIINQEQIIIKKAFLGLF